MDSVIYITASWLMLLISYSCVSPRCVVRVCSYMITVLKG